MDLNQKLINKILEIIKSNKRGTTIKEIMENLKISRFTADKYLYYLKGAKKIEERRIGRLRLYY